MEHEQVAISCLMNSIDLSDLDHVEFKDVLSFNTVNSSLYQIKGHLGSNKIPSSENIWTGNESSSKTQPDTKMFTINKKTNWIIKLNNFQDQLILTITGDFILY